MATAAASTVVTSAGRSLFDRLLPDRLLAALALAMLAVVAVAVARGQADWSRVAPIIWVHLATMAVALALTPAMLVRRKGTPAHRALGYVWVAAMLLSAGASLFFNARAGHGRNLGVFSGDFSPIHLLSAYVLVMVPRLVWMAHTHRVAKHRAGIRGMIIGALLIAGFFTFPFGRLLGAWLLG